MRTNFSRLSKKVKNPRILFGIALILLIVLGLLYIRYAWIKAQRETSERAVTIAKTAKAGFLPGAIRYLINNPNILHDPVYKDTKASLEDLIRINKDIRFAYIFERKNDKLYFMVDSEEPNSKDYSPPGQEYTEASKECIQPFIDGKVAVLESHTDRWGTWVSILVPIEDTQTNQVIAVLGMDYSINTWNNYAVSQALLAGAIVIVSILLLISFYGVMNRNLVLKKERNKLQESELRLKLTTESANIGLWEWFVQDGKTIFNEQWAQITGYELKELAPVNIDTWKAHTHPEDLKKSDELLEKHFKGESEYYECEVRMKHKDGSWVWVLDRGKVIEFDEGKPIRMAGVHVDVTKSKEAEEALRESEERFRVLVENSHDIIYTLTSDGLFTFVSPAWTVLLGHPVDQVIGHPFMPFVNTDDVAGCMDFLKLVIETGQRQEGVTYRVRHHDGTWKWHTSSAVPTWDKDGKANGIIGIARDITKQKQDELELMAEKEKAEAANAAKGQFLANMSHEIRTPINGIVGFLQLLERTELDATQKEYVQGGISSSEVLLCLISDILDFSKIEAGKLSMEKIKFNIRTTVEDAVSTVVPKANEKNILINSFIKSNVPEEVLGDPSRLRQVLNNLLSNAIKFTNKGEVAINVEMSEEVNNISTIQFEIRDTGIGINKEVREKLFKPFTQADNSTTRKYGGTGLGLVISRQLVNLMNGDIGVKSTEGEGSVFYFTAKFEIVSKNNDKINVNYNKLSNIQVLIVDDNKTNQKITKKYLEEYDIKVFEAGNGEDAVSELLKHADDGNPIQIVISDYNMPNMDGNELASKIKALPSIENTKLILFTSVSQKGDAAKAKKNGFAAYLSKPIKRDELIGCAMMLAGLEKKEENIITKYTQKEVEKECLPKILLVEDNAVNRKVVVSVLKNNGLSCDIAENGEEAYRACIEKNYDIVFMDCQMPIMDGYESTQKIRAEEGIGKHTRIVAMTANVMEGDREKCFEIGMDDYIGKPIDFELLLKMVNESVKNKDIREPKLDFIENAINDFLAETGLTINEVEDIFDDYMDSVPNMLNDIENAVIEGNCEEIHRLSHKLKGCSGNLKVNVIYQLSAEIEESAREDNINKCKEIFESIKKLFKQ